MADAASQSQQSIAFIAEVTRGTTPTTPGYTYNRIRVRLDLFGQQAVRGRARKFAATANPARESAACLRGRHNQFILGARDVLGQLLKGLLSSDFAAVSPGAITGDWAASGKRLPALPVPLPAKARRSVGSWRFVVCRWHGQQPDLEQRELPAPRANQSLTRGHGRRDDRYPVDRRIHQGADSEIMKCTARTATTLTVVRGAWYKLPPTHLDNAPVLIGRIITGIYRHGADLRRCLNRQ